MAMIDTLDQHYKVMFADNVRQLCGSPERSVFKELCDHDNQQGEVVFFDSYGGAEAATVIEMANAKSRAKHGDATYADLLNLRTPHMNIERFRTALSGKIIEWGHTMDSVAKLAEVKDPHSKTLGKGMQQMWTKEDWIFINALFATSVKRGKDVETLADVAFPSSQVIELATQSLFTLPVVSQMKMMFQQKKYRGKIICAIPTTVMKIMIDNSDNKLTNKDFVDSSRYLTNYELPEIYGISFMPTDLLDAPINNGTSTKVRFAAWAKEAMIWNQWENIGTQLGLDPGEKFSAKAYIREVCGCVRNDDGLVIQGFFTGEEEPAP